MHNCCVLKMHVFGRLVTRGLLAHKKCYQHFLTGSSHLEVIQSCLKIKGSSPKVNMCVSWNPHLITLEASRMCQRFKVGEHHSYMLSKELVKFHAIGAQKKKTQSKEVGIKNAIQRPPPIGWPPCTSQGSTCLGPFEAFGNCKSWQTWFPHV